MNIQDPISDFLNQINNAYLSKKEYIIVFSSKFKLLILNLLKKENFIENYYIINDSKILKVKILLKYYGKNIPILKKIKKISKPSMRVYCNKDNIPVISNGFGRVIISTSKGLLTDLEAKKQKCGGEIICILE